MIFGILSYIFVVPDHVGYIIVEPIEYFIVLMILQI